MEAKAEGGPGGGRSVLLKGLRPGSRYAAQLVAVNSAGDESAAPPLCTAAELAARGVPTSCAPEAVVPEQGRELEWPHHGGLMLSGGLVGLLLLVAAACAFARAARRRGSGRGAGDSASASDSTGGDEAGDGGEGRSVKRRDDPQPLPPPAPPAPPTPPAAAPTRQRTLLYRATQPIWRVFAEDHREDRRAPAESHWGSWHRWRHHDPRASLRCANAQTHAPLSRHPADLARLCRAARRPRLWQLQPRRSNWLDGNCVTAHPRSVGRLFQGRRTFYKAV